MLFDVTACALAMFKTQTYCGTHARQIYEYERAHNLTRRPFCRWWWDACYSEARLERAYQNGLAERSPHGLIYTGSDGNVCSSRVDSASAAS